MKKFTQIILNPNYTDKMVEDFNSCHEDILGLDIEKLNLVKDNIVKLIASVDDLKRTITEEIEKKERNKEKEFVDNYFGLFTNSSSNSIIKSDTGLTLEEVKKDESKKEIKKNNKKQVPSEILKAVELAKKYKVGVPYIENGDIVKLIEDGKITAQEAMIPINTIYTFLLETKTASKEDSEYIMKQMLKDIKLEDILNLF